MLGPGATMSRGLPERRVLSSESGVERSLKVIRAHYQLATEPTTALHSRRFRASLRDHKPFRAQADFKRHHARMATIAATGGVPADAKTFLGHPRGLYMLFFAEMWERFSYYGMRAILIFYLTKHFLFTETPAYAIYGAYTSMVYITPVLGGYLADKYLGARKAVLAGGVLIAIGHLLIALVEGPQGAQGGYLNGFYAGLAFIIVGTGFLKANISVLVGQLYRRDDVRRQTGLYGDGRMDVPLQLLRPFPRRDQDDELGQV